jgi:GNAT superfamily N-acetyltransferase
MEQSPQQSAHPAGRAPSAETATLQDGTTITIRPIYAADEDALRRFHSRLSERSIYRRFFQLLPVLSEERAEYFTHLDHVTRHAVVALDPARPEEIVGVARYDLDEGTGGAEYAVIVEDRWQNRGIGWYLTLRLIRDALANGLASFYAYVLPENRPMLNLFHDLELPVRERRQPDGLVRVEIDLRPAREK